MSKGFIGVIVGCLFFMACQKKQVYYEGKDHDLEVRLIKIKNDTADTASISYTARIIPDKSIAIINNEDVKTAMMYKMDSCFYIQTKQKKIYPDIIQSVANGLSNQFEYLVSFDSGIPKDDLVMVYQDKYLNKRKYTLKLIKE